MNHQKKKRKSSWDYFNDFGIFLFILLLPTQLGKHFFFPFSYLSGVRVDYLSPTLYITDLLAFGLILLNIKTLLKVLHSKFYLLTFGLLAVNIIFSLSPLISLYWSLKIFELLAIGIIFRKKVFDKKSMLIGFFLGSLFNFFLCILQFINKHSIQGFFYFLGERLLSLSTPGVAKASLGGTEFLRPYGTFSHPNSMAGFYLLAYFFILTSKPFSRFFLLKHATLLLCSLLVFISFSKIAILTFLLLNGFYLFTTYKKIGCKPCVIARILTILVVSIVFASAQTDPQTAQKRIELVGNALQIIIRYPIMGTGVGTYLVAQENFVSKFPLFFNQPVHNVFLLYFAQMGIVIGGILVFLVFRNWKGTIKPYGYIIFAIIITGFFDHYWLTLQQNLMLLAVVLGVL